MYTVDLFCCVCQYKVYLGCVLKQQMNVTFHKQQLASISFCDKKSNIQVSRIMETVSKGIILMSPKSPDSYNDKCLQLGSEILYVDIVVFRVSRGVIGN